MKNIDPFDWPDEDDNVLAFLESDSEISKLFEKYDYEPNGYCWEGHITLILEEKNATLLESMEFDSEAGMFCAVFTDVKIIPLFLEIMVPIFQNMDLLKSYILKADRDRIDD